MISLEVASRLRRIAPYVQDWERQARTVDVEVEFTDPAETENLSVVMLVPPGRAS